MARVREAERRPLRAHLLTDLAGVAPDRLRQPLVEEFQRIDGLAVEDWS